MQQQLQLTSDAAYTAKMRHNPVALWYQYCVCGDIHGKEVYCLECLLADYIYIHICRYTFLDL